MSQSESARHALGWSGQTLILAEVVPSPMLLGLDPGQEQADLLLQEDGPFRAAVSPDGEWIAYNSNQSGTFVTWVRPMSGIDGRRLRVSQDGGTSPAWSPDGSELFYRNGEAMMAASFDADTFSIVDRQTLFEGEYLTTNGRNYDVAPSGDRFLMVKSRATPGMRSSGDDLHLVTDWFEELKARVPVN